MYSATPRRDAVLAWLAGDRLGPIEWPEEPRSPDPFAGLTADERVAVSIRMAASGAPAELPPRTVMIGGKPVPPPPRQPRPPRPKGRQRPPRKATP